MPKPGPTSLTHTSPGMHCESLSQSPPPWPQGQPAEQNVVDPNVREAHADGTHTSVAGDILKAGPKSVAQVNPSWHWEDSQSPPP